jgi:hypothetical protein
MDLNQFPKSYFAPKTKLSIKKYDGLMKLQSSFHVWFTNFCIKECYNLYHSTSNWLKFGILANWQRFFPSIRLDFQKNS